MTDDHQQLLWLKTEQVHNVFFTRSSKDVPKADAGDIPHDLHTIQHPHTRRMRLPEWNDETHTTT